MSIRLTWVDTFYGDDVLSGAPIGTFGITSQPSYPAGAYIDYGSGEVVDWTMTDGALSIVSAGNVGIGASEQLTVSGLGTLTIDLDVLDILVSTSTSGQHSALVVSDTSVPNNVTGGGLFSDTVVSLVINEGEGAPFLIVGGPLGSGLGVWRFADDALLSLSTHPQATFDVDGVADLAYLHIGGHTYLYAALQADHALGVWSLDASGTLTATGQLGASDGVPVWEPSAIDVITLNGQSFVIMASAGSSSLTVFSADSDGQLSFVDHVLDTRDTRFANANILDVVEYDGRAYVVVAGSDDGVSLFTLSRAGQLLHLDTLEDGLEMSLESISALSVTVGATGLDILVRSAHESGISHLHVDLSDQGAVQSGTSVVGAGQDDMLFASAQNSTLVGGAGDDFLYDGAGADYLVGGQGADIFIMSADGQSDRIEDFVLGEDLLDLSSWTMFRDVVQLGFQPTQTGARITFRDETLVINTLGGHPLSEPDLEAIVVAGADRVPVTLQPIELPEPVTLEPAPRPVVPVVSPDPVAPVDPTPTPPDPTPDPVPVEPTPTVTPSPVTPDPATPAPVAPVVDPGQVIFGTPGVDSLTGGAGDDFIDGLESGDRISGLAGDDSLLGGDGNDFILGGAGSDNIPGRDGNDTLYGNRGDDQLGGGNGTDFVYGGPGNDLAGAGDGNDEMNAGSGDDWFSGGWGNDLVHGGDGNDKLAGSYNNDSVHGDAGNDSLGGGHGHDLLFGGAGNDVIGAGSQNDTLYGGQGNDSLGGALNHDQLFGGQGNDTINGAFGNDTLTGGSGADIFFFNTAFSDGQDIITDFTQGQDLIRLVGTHIGGGQRAMGQMNLTNAEHQGYAGVWISYGDHDIFVRNVSASNLSPQDFLFT